MRKAVAVPYVIALVLGIAVVGLLGAWFVISGGKLGKGSAELECKNVVSVHCSKLVSNVASSLTAAQVQQCNNAGITPPGDLAKCKEQGYVS